MVKSAEVCSAVVPHLQGAPISVGFIHSVFMRANHEDKQTMVGVLESLMASLDGWAEWGQAGKVFRFAGDYARALTCHERALQLVVETEGRDSAAYADLSYSMSSTLDKAGRYEEAIQHCQEALRVEELLFGSDSEEVAGTYYRMGWILNMQDKRGEAIEWMTKALVIEEKTLGRWHKSTAATLGGLCSAYRGAGRLVEAMDHAERGHAIEERIFPAGSSTLGINHYNWAEFDSIWACRMRRFFSLKRRATFLRTSWGRSTATPFETAHSSGWPSPPAAVRRRHASISRKPFNGSGKARSAQLTSKPPRKPWPLCLSIEGQLPHAVPVQEEQALATRELHESTPSYRGNVP